jgi:hypothetical protein
MRPPVTDDGLRVGSLRSGFRAAWRRWHGPLHLVAEVEGGEGQKRAACAGPKIEKAAAARPKSRDSAKFSNLFGLPLRLRAGADLTLRPIPMTPGLEQGRERCQALPSLSR